MYSITTLLFVYALQFAQCVLSHECKGNFTVCTVCLLIYNTYGTVGIVEINYKMLTLF